MSDDQLSHFDEKGGTVRWETDWGCWWQTVHEVHIEIRLPEKTKSKEIFVDVKLRFIEVSIKKEILIKGNLFKTVHADDIVWTIEDGSLLNIVLTKADPYKVDNYWESLLDNGGFKPDPLTLHEMRKKLDLERFQIENPGFDFSSAKLQKCYDKAPL